MLLDRVRIYNGDLLVVGREPPGDALTHDVLDLLVVQRQHRELRMWLAFLAQDAEVRVGERLLRAGLVETVSRRGFRGTSVHYMPTTSDQRNAVAWASVRLANLLTQGHPMDLADRALTGLVYATGLTRHVLWDLSFQRSGMTNMYAIVESLPNDLRELVEQTAAAVGSVLAAGRR